MRPWEKNDVPTGICAAVEISWKLKHEALSLISNSLFLEEEPEIRFENLGTFKVF